MGGEKKVGKQCGRSGRGVRAAHDVRAPRTTGALDVQIERLKVAAPLPVLCYVGVTGAQFQHSRIVDGTSANLPHDNTRLATL